GVVREPAPSLLVGKQPALGGLIAHRLRIELRDGLRVRGRRPAGERCVGSSVGCGAGHERPPDFSCALELCAPLPQNNGGTRASVPRTANVSSEAASKNYSTYCIHRDTACLAIRVRSAA